MDRNNLSFISRTKRNHNNLLISHSIYFMPFSPCLFCCCVTIGDIKNKKQ